MKVVVAIDSFKGCLTSVEANQVAADGVLNVCPDADVVQVPVSDGGEGFVEAFHVMLLTSEERHPMIATSYGTGQLVVDAVRHGAIHIIVGLGGSATSDAGIGMLKALVDAWAKQGTFDDIKELRNVHFTIASDVKNPLYGENGAAYVFAPQKGATPTMVRHLDARARKFAELSAKHFGYDYSEKEGAGAAGGLGYAFLQYLNAECRSGIDLLLNIVHFSEIVKDADLVITGEGSADRQTLMGKLPMGILRHSGNVPVCLITLEEAMRPEVARQHLSRTALLCTEKIRTE